MRELSKEINDVHQVIEGKKDSIQEVTEYEATIIENQTNVKLAIETMSEFLTRRQTSLQEKGGMETPAQGEYLDVMREANEAILTKITEQMEALKTELEQLEKENDARFRHFEDRQSAYHNRMWFKDMIEGDIKEKWLAVDDYEYFDMEIEQSIGDRILKKDIETLGDGSKYKGEWNSKGEKEHGQGVKIDENGTLYEGYFLNGEKHFRGRLFLPNGEIYDGEWLNDKLHGKGKYTWPGGAEYDGGWADGKKEGVGDF